MSLPSLGPLKCSSTNFHYENSSEHEFLCTTSTASKTSIQVDVKHDLYIQEQVVCVWVCVFKAKLRDWKRNKQWGWHNSNQVCARSLIRDQSNKGKENPAGQRRLLGRRGVGVCVCTRANWKGGHSAEKRIWQKSNQKVPSTGFSILSVQHSLNLWHQVSCQ